MEPIRRPWGLIMLAGLAALPWLGLIFSELTRPSARGEYMVGYYVIQFTMLQALWVLLAAILLVGILRGAAPAGMALAAILVLLFAAVATFLGMDKASSRRFAYAAFLLLPPLFTAYAFWARIPGLRARIGPVPATAGVFGPAMLLSVACLAAR